MIDPEAVPPRKLPEDFEINANNLNANNLPITEGKSALYTAGEGERNNQRAE
jgi:hypothetical protein